MSTILMALVAALLFGASTPISKLLLDSLAPFQLAGCLYLGAALGVLPAVLAEGRSSASHGKRLSESPGRKQAVCLAGAILFGGILGPVAVLHGLRLASAATVSMWLNLELAATAVLGALVFKDHLGRAGWAGALGTFGAALMLTWQEGAAGPAALAFLVAAGLCWGMDNHLTALIDHISPARSTLYKGAVAGMTNAGISFLWEPFSSDWALVGAALVVGALAYGVSICLYILSAQNLGATRSQLVFSTAPFFGVLLSAAILGESISALQGAAALILVLSLGILFRDRHRHRHTHEAQSHTHRHTHGDGHHSHGHQDPESAAHSHWHTHDTETHSHIHWPDLHHRHRH